MTTPWRRDLAAGVTSALLVGLAFPPFNFGLPSFVCLVPAIVALERHVARGESIARDAILGAWFGLLGNAVVLHWMLLALWNYHHRLVIGFVAGLCWLAVATAAAFTAAGWIRRRTSISIVVVFPVVWTALEWALAHQPVVPVTWLGLGTSLTGFPPLVQVADITGARGVTFLLAAANAAVALAWRQRHETVPASIILVKVALGVAAAACYGIVRISSLHEFRLMTVAAVQTEIAAGRKWRPELARGIEADLVHLSRRTAAQRADLIAWPETALPGALLYHPDWRNDVRALARDRRAYVMAGAIEAVVRGPRIDQYNAAFLTDPDGREARGTYRKRALVPFFERWNGMERGDGAMIFATARGAVGVLICDESSFESLSRDYRRRGAGALINLANDAWFHAGAGPSQHAAHLVMRAIETRMGIARAANAGITEIVDPTGRVRQRLPRGTAGVLQGSLMATASIPFYVRAGDWVGLLSIVGSALLILRATVAPIAAAESVDLVR